MMESFVFAASRTLLQQFPAYLNFILDSEGLFCCYKQKSDFYEMTAAQTAVKHGDE